MQLRHNLMQRQSHVMCLGHITHSPKDYQAIGITLNLATRLYMRHLVRFVPSGLLIGLFIYSLLLIKLVIVGVYLS